MFSISVLFATDAIAAKTGGLQEVIGDSPGLQQALLASADPTENLPQSAAPELKPAEKKSARSKKPGVRSVKQKKRIPGSTLPTSSRVNSRTSGNASGKNKINPSDKLSLSLSMMLSISGNAAAQSGNPTKEDVTPEGPVEKEKKLRELYAQIAETEKLIQAQQRQLDMMNKPATSSLNFAAANTSIVGTNVAGSGVIVQGIVHGNPQEIDKGQTKATTSAPEGQPSSKGTLSQFEPLEMNWMELATGIAVLLLAVPGFVWYRKGKAASQDTNYQLDVLSNAQEVTGPANTKKSVPVVERSMKTPAHIEKKSQSILPPEYEMLEEADIYLRFGHDKLAEEALREAIRINPKNPQAYLTLSRIYFSRGDSLAFLDLAKQLKSLGDVNVWNKVAEMGHSLDQNNPLYR
jgi:Tfp pilus assembly protein FimV